MAQKRGLPEARVFRPQGDKENELIERLMRVHAAQGEIQQASWTQYVAFLVNRDLAQVRYQYQQRLSGRGG